MEKDYTIAEEFELPSKALIYDDIKFDPHVKLRSMTVRDDCIRQGASSHAHKKICELIDDCLLTKLPISVYDMHVGDYEYLLHKLRIVTYGPDYKMAVGCPHCGAIKEAIVDLDSLKIKEFDVKTFSDLQEVTLPKSGDTITLEFQTPRTLDDIDAKVKEFKKQNPEAGYDPTTLIILQHAIKTVNGTKLKYIELDTYVNKLNAKDANFILNKIQKLNSMVGLDTEVDVSCAICGGDIKTYFRFGPEFFRPSDNE